MKLLVVIATLLMAMAYAIPAPASPTSAAVEPRASCPLDVTHLGFRSTRTSVDPLDVIRKLLDAGEIEIVSTDKNQHARRGIFDALHDHFGGSDDDDGDKHNVGDQIKDKVIASTEETVGHAIGEGLAQAVAKPLGQEIDAAIVSSVLKGRGIWPLPHHDGNSESHSGPSDWFHSHEQEVEDRMKALQQQKDKIKDEIKKEIEPQMKEKWQKMFSDENSKARNAELGTLIHCALASSSTLATCIWAGTEKFKDAKESSKCLAGVTQVGANLPPPCRKLFGVKQDNGQQQNSDQQKDLDKQLADLKQQITDLEQQNSTAQQGSASGQSTQQNPIQGPAAQSQPGAQTGAAVEGQQAVHSAAALPVQAQPGQPQAPPAGQPPAAHPVQPQAPPAAQPPASVNSDDQAPGTDGNRPQIAASASVQSPQGPPQGAQTAVPSPPHPDAINVNIEVNGGNNSTSDVDVNGGNRGT